MKVKYAKKGKGIYCENNNDLLLYLSVMFVDVTPRGNLIIINSKLTKVTGTNNNVALMNNSRPHTVILQLSKSIMHTKLDESVLK